MLRFAALLVIAIALVACSAAPAATPIVIFVTPEPGEPSPQTPAAAPATQQPPTEAPVDVSTPTPTTQPTPSATPSPTPTPTPTRAPRPTASASKGDPLLLTWASHGYVTAQVIIPVVNDGGTWIRLQEYQSQFTIYDRDGSVTETQGLRAAAPKRLAPGETGYLVGEVFSDDHPRAAYDRVEADAYYDEADQAERVTVDNVRVRRASFGDGVEVTGEATNSSDERIDNADVVALFFDAEGNILGYASGFVENIEPNGRRAFQIDSSFAEIRLGDVDETQVWVSPWDF